jgi:hypothetical protein
VPPVSAGGSARFGLAGPEGRALTIVAVADDPELLAAIAGAGRERDLVITSPTADRFVDQLMANSVALAVIDAACAPPPLEEFIARVHAQFPQLLLILAGSAMQQAAFAARLVDGTLFRFAHKPASAQRMQLFIDAARRHLDAGNADTGAARSAQDLAPVAPRETRAPYPALIGAVLLAGLLWLGWGTLHPAVTPPRRPPAAASPLSTAAPSLTAPGRIEPLAKDPLMSDAAARATAMVGALGTLPPVAAAMPPGPFLELARARLASHDLIEPAGDSALFYVEAAQALTPADPEVTVTAVALGEALITQTRQALNAGDAEAARRWLGACTDYRISESTLAELSARLRQLEAVPSVPSVPSVPPAAAPAARDP